jgi:hypothetical protein
LEVDVFGGEECCERCKAFVVKALQLLARADGNETGVEGRKGVENSGAGAAFH